MPTTPALRRARVSFLAPDDDAGERPSGARRERARAQASKATGERPVRPPIGAPAGPPFAGRGFGGLPGRIKMRGVDVH